MGSPCLFTRQQSLKLGYFYWLRVKHSNPLLTELSLCYLKHTKFYLEHNASFIQISSLASFNSVLIAWLWAYCTFSDSSKLAGSPRLDPNTPNTKLFPPKNHVLLSNFFSSSIMFFIRLFVANTWEKNRGSPCLFPHKLLWKVDMVLRSQSGWIICAAGTGARYNRKAASYLSSRMKYCPINSLWVLQVYPEPTFVTEGKSESKERRTKRGTIKLTSRQTAPTHTVL